MGRSVRTELAMGDKGSQMPKQITLINPFRCRLWDLHDRFEANITEES